VAQGHRSSAKGFPRHNVTHPRQAVRNGLYSGGLNVHAHSWQSIVVFWCAK